ncbi:Aminotran 1 2 domain containing protein, partial [Asbolus verrucosus]
VEYAQLASKYKPLDLGHGFPNFPPPQYVTDALLEVANNKNSLIHQYTRGGGHPRLVSALSKLYSGLMKREINPYTEIITTQGGSHAIFCAIMGIVDKGDEVILMEPFFDSYIYNVKSAGGIIKCIPLKLVILQP